MTQSLNQHPRLPITDRLSTIEKYLIRIRAEGDEYMQTLAEAALDDLRKVEFDAYRLEQLFLYSEFDSKPVRFPQLEEIDTDVSIPVDTGRFW